MYREVVGAFHQLISTGGTGEISLGWARLSQELLIYCRKKRVCVREIFAYLKQSFFA
jgi:hypothetical protein